MDMINIGGELNLAVLARCREQVQELNAPGNYHPEMLLPVCSFLNFINYQNDLDFLGRIQSVNENIALLQGPEPSLFQPLQTVAMELGETEKIARSFAESGNRSVSDCLDALNNCTDPQAREPIINELKNGFNQAAKTAANDLVFWTSLASALVLITSAHKLYLIYDEIAAAKSTAKTSTHELEVLRIEVKALKENIDNLQQRVLQLDPRKQKTVSRVMRLTTKLFMDHNEVYQKIGKVEVSVNNQMTSLKIRRMDAAANAFTSGAQGITNVLPLILRGTSLLTMPTLIASSLVTLGLGLICAGSLVGYKLSQQRINELQVILDSVWDLQLKMTELQTVLQRCNNILDMYDEDDSE